jgi:hypothetical protein
MRPAEVEQLIEDLKDEKPHSSVVTQGDGKMVIYLPQVLEALSFNDEECQLLLASRQTVERLFEALDYPEESCVELYGSVAVDTDVMSALEDHASTVDEM